MLSVNSLRVVRPSRALLHPNRLLANRLSVTCSGHCMSTNLHKKDTWQSGINFTAVRKGNRLFYYTNCISSLRNYSLSQVKRNCWKCNQLFEKKPAFFCMSCKVVQPPEEGISYFQIMDCDYTFTLDTQKLQKRYLQLQRALHPDNFSQKSLTELEYSESQSALVNKAYKTLLKPLSRGLYMLELQGMHLEEGTETGADSGFLMELMEINEALDEAQTPEAARKLAELTEQIDAALREGELQAAKALLGQMKYYANIEEKVKEKLSGFM
ncbi:iron-sulfur cluster co-chaperone protein HscB isoform X2 [Acanthochromis polyacanthus]|uniref:iron-sulfur cluster co-chaperone protein HscB isoform X2 n=1 Tax=Acanthochromis polyacanthus TaxID=80966 RepID=UPI0022340637|nr:iron-sulfur cluster co-chaperone protein HscB isoform X2 [Acanthochromis polyacanthus]